jgi:hypothetical protein
MRGLADASLIREFLRALGAEAQRETRLYLIGGATAVLLGWLESTIDLDLKLVPEDEGLLRALPRVAEAVAVNVERTSPSDYLPEPPGWEDRSPFVSQEGRLACYHYDLQAQALAKIARGHAQDLIDLQAMLTRGLVTPEGVREHLRSIEPHLQLYPNLDARSLRRLVDAALGSL